MQKNLSEVVEERMKKVRIAKRQQQGFTLIELIVTVVLAGILLAFAIPSYQELTISTDLRTTSNKLVNALNLARMEAIKRNTRTQFCGDSAASNGAGVLGAACGSNSGAVYTLVKDAGGNDVAKSIWAALPASNALHVQSVKGLQFGPEGLATLAAGAAAPYTGTVAIVCSDNLSVSNRRVISMVTGSNFETKSATGGC